MTTMQIQIRIFVIFLHYQHRLMDIHLQLSSLSIACYPWLTRCHKDHHKRKKSSTQKLTNENKGGKQQDNGQKYNGSTNMSVICTCTKATLQFCQDIRWCPHTWNIAVYSYFLSITQVIQNAHWAYLYCWAMPLRFMLSKGIKDIDPSVVENVYTHSFQWFANYVKVKEKKSTLMLLVLW